MLPSTHLAYQMCIKWQVGEREKERTSFVSKNDYYLMLPSDHIHKQSHFVYKRYLQKPTFKLKSVSNISLL